MKNRQTKIEILAGNGNLTELKKLLNTRYSKLELDVALENAVAYSQIETAEYLISVGADLSNYDYQGAYYAVHNNELNGLKFAIKNGVDININKGQLLNESIVTAYNEKDTTILKWLLENKADVSLLSDDIMKTFGTPELSKIIKDYETKSSFVKIIECFNITGLGFLTEIQHSLNGIPPNTALINKDTNETWIVKKRVFNGILLLDESEKYFQCETESMHVDSSFKDLSKREIAVKKEVEKRKKGIYLYLLKPENKKNKIKPEKETLLKIKRQHNTIYSK